MVFNSWKFVLFFLLVYTAYLLLRRNHRSQNLLLLGASYYFYATWDWRFAGLMLLTTVVDWACGLSLGATTAPWKRKLCVLVSVCCNLTLSRRLKNGVVRGSANFPAGPGRSCLSWDL